MGCSGELTSPANTVQNPQRASGIQADAGRWQKGRHVRRPGRILSYYNVFRTFKKKFCPEHIAPHTAGRTVPAADMHAYGKFQGLPRKKSYILVKADTGHNILYLFFCFTARLLYIPFRTRKNIKKNKISVRERVIKAFLCRKKKKNIHIIH